MTMNEVEIKTEVKKVVSHQNIKYRTKWLPGFHYLCVIKFVQDAS